MAKILLSISILVSNRIDTIRKCMESLRPILASVPSELIALDTGCTDGSIGVVSEYTDKIYKFEWIKDFSAARNECLKRASGEWFMFIDDDEWFEDAAEIVEFFKSGEYREYGTADYKIRNYTLQDGSTYIDTFAGRMSRITDGLRFEGRVHEAMLPLYLPRKSFGCYCHHYGYAFADEVERRRHAERNIELLKKEIEDNSQNTRAITHLIQEFYILREWEKVSNICEQVLGSFSGDWTDPEIQYIVVFKARNMNNAGEGKAALEYIKTINGKYPVTERSKLLLAVEGVLAANMCGDYDAAIEYGEAYCKMLDEYHKNQEKFHLNFVMDDVNYISDEMRNKIMFIACKNAAMAGDEAKADVFYEKVSHEIDMVFEATKNMFLNSSSIKYTLRKSDMETFACIIKSVLEAHSPKTFLDYIISQKEAFADYPEMYEFARMILLEEQILRDVDNEVNTELKYEELNDLFYLYSDAVCAYTELMYRGDFLNVPDNCRFVMYFLRSEEERAAGHIKESLALKKEAAKAYPVMLPVIQAWIQSYASELMRK